MMLLTTRRFEQLALITALVTFPSCRDTVVPDNPTPGISALSPTDVEQGAPELTLTVTGSDFVQNSVVRFNGSDRPTQFVSRSELRATLPASDFTSAGLAQIAVVNPAPGGGGSNVVPLTIRARTNPIPVITSFSPEFVTAGSARMAITLTGTGFVQQSRVWIGNTAWASMYVSPTQLRFSLSDSITSAGGVLAIRVVNPTPGGGVSNTANYEVRTPTPTLASLSATQTTAGQESYLLRVTGSGFVTRSEVRFNGAPRPTRLVSPGTLEATLSAGDLRAAGSYTITVANPTPGGGTSNPLSLQIVNGSPEITLLPSRGANAGRPGFTLIVHGRGFVEGSVVRWNGSDRPTQYISATRVSATISSGDVAAAGTAQISVHNPAPGGGSSASATFTVRDVPPPTILSRRVVPLRARDIVYDRRTQRLYASVTGTSETNPNSVVAIDPNTGSITRSVFVGSEPGRLALSDDGQYLYVGLNGASAVRRVEVATFAPGLQWSLGADEVAGDMEVAPGQPKTVAVSRQRPGTSPPLTGVTIYDDGVARAVSSPGHTGGNRIEFLESASVLYGFNNSHTGFEFFTIAIDGTGARHSATTRGLISGFYTHITGASGRIYGTDGSVVDAERRVRLGRFPGTGSAIAVAPHMGRAFMLTESAVQAYDLNTYQLLGAVPISGINFDHPALASTRLVLWGSDGLAFLDQDELFLIRSPIATH